MNGPANAKSLGCGGQHESRELPEASAGIQLHLRHGTPELRALSVVREQRLGVGADGQESGRGSLCHDYTGEQ